MNEINLNWIINENPDCLKNEAKLKAILLDSYPDITKGIINAILIISSSGIAEEIRNSGKIDNMTTNRWLKQLENDYCMSGSTVEKCLQLWISCFQNTDISSLLNKKPDANDEDIIDAIEYDSSLFSLCGCDLTKNIIYYNHILKTFKKYKGCAYYELAKQLRRYDLFIRTAESGFDYTEQGPIYLIEFFDGDYCSFASFEKPSWKTYSDELKAICSLINYNTTNINLLIEHLLQLSLQSKYNPAFEALIETYLDENYYPENISPFDEDILCYPWFDINHMNHDFNSLDIEYNDSIDDKMFSDNRLLSFYAKKALKLLENRMNYLNEDIPPEQIELHYKYLAAVLGKGVQHKP